MIKKIKCLLDKHNYYVIERYSETVRKVGCKHCSKQWGMNDRIMAFIPWDKDLEEQHKLIRAIPSYH